MIKEAKNLENTLSLVGLSDQEVKFYLALLETGSSTIKPIAQKAGIKRTSAYNFIDHLVELGLVSYSIKNNRHYYRAEHPGQIKKILSEKQQTLEDTLPELVQQYHKQAGHPETKLFYGVEGMKKAILDSMNCQEKKVYAIIDLASAVGNLGVKTWEEYAEESTKKGIVVHSLRHQEQKVKLKEYKYLKKEQYLKTLVVPRYLPRNIKIPNTFIIYDNKVITISPLQENWALVTESNSFSQTMKVFHGVLWKMSR